MKNWFSNSSKPKATFVDRLSASLTREIMSGLKTLLRDHEITITVSPRQQKVGIADEAVQDNDAASQDSGTEDNSSKNSTESVGNN